MTSYLKYNASLPNFLLDDIKKEILNWKDSIFNLFQKSCETFDFKLVRSALRLLKKFVFKIN